MTHYETIFSLTDNEGDTHLNTYKVPSDTYWTRKHKLK